MVSTLLTASEAATASKQLWRLDLTSYLKSVTSIIHMYIAYMFWTHFVADHITADLQPAKKPRRSDLTSDLKSVTSITYANMFVWAV